MFVADRMTHPVITVHPDLPITDALNLMRKDDISRLPVVDKRGRLVGIVSEKDLLHAAPSSATSLSVWELNYLLSKIIVKDTMQAKVVTVSADTPIEEAARIMIDNAVHGLPVMKAGKLVGIITETDIFKVFLEMLGAREAGIRVTALVGNVPGEFARLTKAVYDIGGNILAMASFLGESTEDRQVTLKVEGVEQAALKKAIQPVVKRLDDVREMTPA